MAIDDECDYTYCENCDTTQIFEELPHDELFNHWRCPKCGKISGKLVVSDYGYALQNYLLQCSDGAVLFAALDTR